MSKIETTLGKKQIFLSRLVVSIAAIFFGILLLLAALNLFSAPLKSLILPLLFSTIALLALTLALIQQNTLLLWFFPLFAALSLTFFLSAYTVLPLKLSFPLYALAFAIGSFLVIIYDKFSSDHLKVILLFAPISGILALYSWAILQLIAAAAAVLIYVGICATAYTIYKKIKGQRK